MKSKNPDSTNALRNFIREVVESEIDENVTDLVATSIADPQELNATVIDALKAEEGDVRNTAKKLGVSPRTLYNILKDHPPLKQVKDKESSKDSK